MFTKQEFKDALSDEIRIIRHIATKLDPATTEWRPAANMRSTIELLRYLAMCGIGTAKAILDDDWDVIGPIAKKVENLTLAGFDQAMKDQERELLALVDAIAEEDLVQLQAKLPWGTEDTLGGALYGTSVRFFTAYRMQLFLYAKQSGASELDTSNAWMGVDRPKAANA